MDLTGITALPEGLRFPRTRGDGPVLALFGMGYGTFPPHARGWTGSRRLRRRRPSVSPARAGMDRVFATDMLIVAGFPARAGMDPLPRAPA